VKAIVGQRNRLAGSRGLTALSDELLAPASVEELLPGQRGDRRCDGLDGRTGAWPTAGRSAASRPPSAAHS